MIDASLCESEAITLANDAIQVVVARLGGQVTSLRSKATGREWLWRNPHLSPRTSPRSTVDFGPHDTGGWDEIFPTVSPCIVADSPWGRSPIADHGELWHRKWKLVELVSFGDGGAVTLAVDEPELPFRFERTLTIAPGRGELLADYSVENRSAAPLPFVWAAHPLIAATPGMTIALPRGVRMTAAVCMGFELESRSRCFDWPRAALANGRTIDFSRVPAYDSGIAAKLFSDRLSDGWLSLILEESKESLCVSFDAGEVPHIALWLNYGGWSGADTAPYFNCGVEPTTSPHDSLKDALEGNNQATILPRTRRRWKVSVALRSP